MAGCESSHRADSANDPALTRFSFHSLFLIFLKSHWRLKKKKKERKKTHTKEWASAKIFKDNISENIRTREGGIFEANA